MKKLSPLMIETIIDIIAAGGEYERYAGGFWAKSGSLIRHDSRPENYVGTPTIQGLVKRGYLKYTYYKLGRNGHFPVRVRVTDKTETVSPAKETPQLPKAGRPE